MPLIVHDKTTGEQFTFDADLFARKFVEGRWHGCEFGFAYVKDIAEDEALARIPEDQHKQIVLTVVQAVPDGYEGEVPAFGYVTSLEFDTENVWADAYYYGSLADDLDGEDEDGDDDHAA